MTLSSRQPPSGSGTVQWATGALPGFLIMTAPCPYTEGLHAEHANPPRSQLLRGNSDRPGALFNSFSLVFTFNTYF